MRNHATRFILIAAVGVQPLLWPTMAAGQSASTAPDRTVQLLTGTEQTLSADYAIGNTAIGNPGVCEIEVLPGRREVLLIARGIGITTLTLWDQRGRKQEEVRVDVSSRELSKLQSDLMALLGPYPGVRAEPLGNSIVLNGTVASQEALTAVEGIAKAAGVASVVTLGGSLPFGAAGGMAPQPMSPGGQPVSAPAAPQTLLPPDAALPVALTSGGPARPANAAPSAPITVPTGGMLADDDGPPPVAVPNPPPPNVFYVSNAGGSDSLGFGSGLTTSAPVPPGSASATPVGSRPLAGDGMSAPSAATGGRVDYRIELYEQSALAPPPEVMGPQGTKIFSTVLTAYDGRPARELFVADQGGRTSDGQSRPMSGISIELTPIVQGSVISTSMTIDTNLPVGARNATGPLAWRRAQLDFQVQAGATRYVTEQELAGQLSGPGSLSPDFGDGGGGAGVGGAIAAATDVAGRAGQAAGVERAQMVPAIGGLFRLGGGRPNQRNSREQPPSDDRRLVIVVSPILGAAR